MNHIPERASEWSSFHTEQLHAVLAWTSPHDRILLLDQLRVGGIEGHFAFIEQGKYFVQHGRIVIANRDCGCLKGWIAVLNGCPRLSRAIWDWWLSVGIPLDPDSLLEGYVSRIRLYDTISDNAFADRLYDEIVAYPG